MRFLSYRIFLTFLWQVDQHRKSHAYTIINQLKQFESMFKLSSKFYKFANCVNERIICNPLCIDSLEVIGVTNVFIGL